MQNCQDAYFATFPSFAELFGYQKQVNDRSTWTHCAVNQLHVEPLNRNSSCYPALKEFAPGVSQEAVEDSFNNLGLAIRFDQKLYPVRETAYKSLLDRAKISGSGLNKLTKDELAQVLNTFLGHFRSEALVLVRDEKISAVHSGDEADYSILPIDRLLNVLQSKLGDRFPGNVFEGGYSDHAITSAAWSLPDQKEDLIGAYARLLASKGKSAMASRLMPGVRFLTAAHFYEKKSGNRVYDDTFLYQHADYPYALADFDRRFERASDGEPGILECKCTTYRHASDWDDGAFPLYYELQLRYYLSVADVNIGAFSCIWGNNPDSDIAMPELARDTAKEDMIFERLDEWIWSLRHDKPPTMSGIPSKLALDSLARIYQTSDASTEVSRPAGDKDSLRHGLCFQLPRPGRVFKSV